MKINADIESCLAVICEERSCPWIRVCANHVTAGDFRSETGSRPKLHLEQGEVVCETYHSKGNVAEYHESPIDMDPNWDPCDQDAIVLVKDLVEKTNDFVI